MTEIETEPVRDTLKRRRTKQLSPAQALKLIREKHPDALACVRCARIIATRRESYAKSNLSEAQRLGYVCAECRSDADPARSAEVTARFAASKAATKAARLRAPLVGLSPCACNDLVTCASCLQTAVAELAGGRRVAHDYLDTCLTDGAHADLDTLADCSHSSAVIAESRPALAFCAHGRPAENCLVHVRPRLGTPMPHALARCDGCGGWHGKTGRDRCPYTRDEAAAVRAARERAYIGVLA